MKYFIKKIIAFCTPIFIIFLIPAIFLYYSGENYRNIDEIVKNRQNYLIGYAYNEDNYSYLKYKELENRNSLSIIALGSSRVLQFREKMFTKSFYNAGYTISSLADFIPFIEYNLKNKKPEVLLIALDQWMFNENWDDLSEYSLSSTLWQPNFRKFASVSTLFNVWSDLLKGKYGLEILTKKYNSGKLIRLGLNSIVHNKGFRNDGSIYYGDQINKLQNNDSTANDFQFIDTYSRIKNGNRRFQFGKRVNNKSLEVLNDLLHYCKSNDIFLVAILPPFANGINSKLKSSGKYSYMDSIFHKSNLLFKEYSFEIWDMTKLCQFGSNDLEMIDGFHGSEVCYAKMLINMITNGSILNNYTNLDKLKYQVSKRKNNYELFFD